MKQLVARSCCRCSASRPPSGAPVPVRAPDPLMQEGQAGTEAAARSAVAVPRRVGVFRAQEAPGKEVPPVLAPAPPAEGQVRADTARAAGAWAVRAPSTAGSTRLLLPPPACVQGTRRRIRTWPRAARSRTPRQARPAPRIAVSHVGSTLSASRPAPAPATSTQAVPVPSRRPGRRSAASVVTRPASPSAVLVRHKDTRRRREPLKAPSSSTVSRAS